MQGTKGQGVHQASQNCHSVYSRPTVLYKSTTYITIMKLFCETRPIEVMGLGEIGHVIVWRILPLHTIATHIAALSNSQIY